MLKVEAVRETSIKARNVRQPRPEIRGKSLLLYNSRQTMCVTGHNIRGKQSETELTLVRFTNKG